MIKRSSYICILLALLCLAVPPYSFAQEKNETVEQLKKERISPRAASIYMDKCLSKIPRGFTPSAHEEFCTCSAAHMRLHMTNADLVALNQSGAQSSDNPAFQKYVSQIIMPCMEGPIVDITYVSCIEDRGHSPLIKSIPAYCQCVGEELVPFVKNQGSIISLQNMAKYQNSKKDPLQALIQSNEYKLAKNNAYKTCQQSDLEVKGLTQ